MIAQSRATFRLKVVSGSSLVVAFPRSTSPSWPYGRLRAAHVVAWRIAVRITQRSPFLLASEHPAVGDGPCLAQSDSTEFVSMLNPPLSGAAALPFGRRWFGAPGHGSVDSCIKMTCGVHTPSHTYTRARRKNTTAHIMPHYSC